MFDNYTLRMMLKEHGQNVTLRKVTEGAYNPTTGSLGTATLSDNTVRAYFFEFESDAVDGQSILRTDRRVVLSPILPNGNDTPEPNATDKVVGVGDTINILAVDKITSNGKIMCYLLHVRG